VSPRTNILPAKKRITEKNLQIPYNSKVLLIGNGVLADRLITHFRNTNIEFNQIKSLTIARKTGKKKAIPKLEKKEDTLYIRSDSISLQKHFIEKCKLIVIAEDYPNILMFESINQLCFKKRKPWIRVSFDDNIGYIGPLVIPRKTSCFNCCELRLVTNSPNYEYELWRNKENIPVTNLHLPEIYADVLSAICAREVFRYLTNYNHPDTINSLFLLDSRSMKIDKHKIISHPNCILCNPPIRKKNYLQILLNKNYASTLISISEKSKSRVSLSDKELIKTLRGLIDEKTGIILEHERLFENSKVGKSFHYFTSATCSRPLRIDSKGKLIRPVIAENNLITPSPSGSGSSANEAEIHTLMEAVERYSNMVADESRFIWSSYDKIRECAICPSELGLYSEEQYDRKDLACSRFSAHDEIPWMVGHDISVGKNVLVPVDFVYYPAVRESPLVFDTSNGASSHTDIVRAIYNGLLEVIERDAFLTMWLNKISMPVLDIKRLPLELRGLIDIIHRLGMEVKLVNLTIDTQVTTILAACYNNDPNEYPSLIIGTGSHIDPKKALRKAMLEMELALKEAFENPNKKKINHPNQISTIFENSRYYLNPRTNKVWKFMIRGRKTSGLRSIIKSNPTNDLEMLMQIVKQLYGMNHRVVWVDITPHDIKKMGLKVVKVFVTGFQPLYVGNKIRLNLERLRSSAVKLGYVTAAIHMSQLNTAPHPLP
jgi:ribosomal protein S12 methylthiotransferase accessory factor